MAGAEVSAGFQSVVGARAESEPFISELRGRKFDLLLHVAVNVPEPIVLTGPPGIGKSTFLRHLHEAVQAYATVCQIKCTAITSYERIVEELRFAILAESGRRESAGLSLEELLIASDKRYRRVFLLIDDADEMSPGLANALWLIACSHPALRIVMAVSADECRHKAATDAMAFAAARIIDIPPLSPVECTLFLKTLAADQQRGIAAERISTQFKEGLFALTAGSPGLIIDQLDQQGGFKSFRRKINTALWLAGGLSVAVAGVVGVWVKTGEHPALFGILPASRIESNAAPETAVPEPAPVGTSEPAESTFIAPGTDVAEPAASSAQNDPAVQIRPPLSPEPQVAGKLEGANLLPDRLSVAAPEPSVSGASSTIEKTAPPAPPARHPESNPPEPASANATPLSGGAVSVEQGANSAAPSLPNVGTTPAAPVSHTSQTEARVNGLRDAQWILEQDAAKYTLQLAAVSKAADVAALAAQLPPESPTATFRSRKGRADLYPLLFGVFDDVGSAQKALSRLPGSLAKGFVRPLKSVHGEIQRFTGQRQERSAPPPAAQP